MASKIQLRRDTTANWESADPVLSEGEIGWDTTLKQGKVGDGVSLWSELEYTVATPGGGDVVVVSEDTQVDIGATGDFATLTEAFAFYDNAVIANGVFVTLNVLADEVLTETVVLRGKNFSQFIITSGEPDNMIKFEVATPYTLNFAGADFGPDLYVPIVCIDNCVGPILNAGIHHSAEVVTNSVAFVVVGGSSITIGNAVDTPIVFRNCKHGPLVSQSSKVVTRSPVFIYTTVEVGGGATFSGVTVEDGSVWESLINYFYGSYPDLNIGFAPEPLVGETIQPYEYAINLYSSANLKVGVLKANGVFGILYSEVSCHTEICEAQLHPSNDSTLLFASYNNSDTDINSAVVFLSNITTYLEVALALFDCCNARFGSLAFVGDGAPSQVGTIVALDTGCSAVINGVALDDFDAVTIADAIPFVINSSKLRLGTQNLPFVVGDDLSTENMLAATNGSEIHAPNWTLQRGSSEQALDIYIADGSYVNISGGTGGSNVTPNTISSDGILIK